MTRFWDDDDDDDDDDDEEHLLSKWNLRQLLLFLKCQLFIL